MVIFNNYTGDILNFGLALERAKNKSIEVSVILLYIYRIICVMALLFALENLQFDIINCEE